MKLLVLAILLVVLCAALMPLLKRLSRGESFSHRWRRRSAQRAYQRIQPFVQDGARLIKYLRKVDPWVFEEMILCALKDNGFKVDTRFRYTADGGIDGVAYKDNKKFVIQAKRYKSYINAQHLREFIDICRNCSCQGLFIHTGKTGEASRQMIYECDAVTIISGQRLSSFFEKKNG